MEDIIIKQLQDNINNTVIDIFPKTKTEAIVDFIESLPQLNVSQNYLVWTRNGITNNLTVPYATNSSNIVPQAATDLNATTLNRNGVYSWLNTAANTPGTYGTLFQWSNSSAPVNGTNNHWITQLASVTDGGGLWVRTRTNTSAWKAWERILTSSNFDSLIGSNYYTKSEVDNGYVRAGVIDSGDLNTVNPTASFVKSINVTANAPNGNGWYNVIQLAHRNGLADGSGYVGQIALGMTVSHEQMFFRTHRTRAWQSVLTSNNYTSYVSSLRDRTNGTATYLNYGAAGVTTASWLAAWNGYELRAMSPANVLTCINALSRNGGSMANTNVVTNLNADLLDGHQENVFFRSNMTVLSEDSLLTSLPGNRSGSYNVSHTGWYGSVYVFYTQSSNSGLAFYRPGGSNSIPKILTALDGKSTWTDKGTILTSLEGNAVSASKLQTQRTLWGRPFNGTQNVTGNISGVGSITSSGSSFGNYGIYPGSATGESMRIDALNSSGQYSARSIVMFNDGHITIGSTQKTDHYLTVYGTIGVDRGASNFWGAGLGALSVAVPNDSGQTPLLLAYRKGSDVTTAANRLFSMELYDSGNQLRVQFKNSPYFIYNDNGQFQINKTVTANSQISDTGHLRLMNSTGNKNYCLGLGVTPTGYAGIQAGETGIGARPLALNPSGGNVGVGLTNPTYPLHVNGNIKASEIIGGPYNSLRAICDNYGFIIRNDDTCTYFMLTNSGDAYGGFNSLRPIQIYNDSGKVAIASHVLQIDPNDFVSVQGALQVRDSVLIKTGSLRTGQETNGIISNGCAIRDGNIELFGDPCYIDFHYDNSTSDYTSRIIEKSPGEITIEGSLSFTNKLRGNTEIVSIPSGISLGSSIPPDLNYTGVGDGIMHMASGSQLSLQVSMLISHLYRAFGSTRSYTFNVIAENNIQLYQINGITSSTQMIYRGTRITTNGVKNINTGSCTIRLTIIATSTNNGYIIIE